MMSEYMAYIGHKACGCIVAAVVDGDDRKYVARKIAEFINDGLTIERVSSEVVRAGFHVCTHEMRAEQLSLNVGGESYERAAKEK